MVKSGKAAPMQNKLTQSAIQLAQLIQESKVIVVIGTGVSLALTDTAIPALSRKGLIEDGFEYGVAKGRITQQQQAIWKTQLRLQ